MFFFKVCHRLCGIKVSLTKMSQQVLYVTDLHVFLEPESHNSTWTASWLNLSTVIFRESSIRTVWKQQYSVLCSFCGNTFRVC